MREPATTITDYLLALLALYFVFSIARAHRGGRSVGGLTFFSGFAVAAILGGTWHGFFSGPDAAGARVLWWLTQVFTGIAAAGLAVLGMERFGARARTAALYASTVFVIVFAWYVWRDGRFLLTVLASALGTAFCLAGLVREALRGRHRGAALVAGGLALSFVGAFLQQRGFAIDPPHWDHNATYHLWLFAALSLIHAGVRALSARMTPDATREPAARLP